MQEAGLRGQLRLYIKLKASQSYNNKNLPNDIFF